MALTSSAAALICLLALKIYPIQTALPVSVIVGIASSFSEMCSRKGTDTVNVPVLNAIVLWLLSIIV